MNFFNNLFKNKQKLNSVDFTPEEKNKIKLFAKGDKSLKEECINIYHKLLINLSKDSYGNSKFSNSLCMSPEVKFMREIDNKCPDLMLQNLYRLEVLNQEKDN